MTVRVRSRFLRVTAYLTVLAVSLFAPAPLCAQTAEVLPETHWSAAQLLDGPFAVAGGAFAPVGCTVRYVIFPFQMVAQESGTPGGWHAGITATLFYPVIVAFGAIGGAVRGTMLVGTGILDSVTGGYFRLSEPVWGDEIYTSLPWCGGGATPAHREKRW